MLIKNAGIVFNLEKIGGNKKRRKSFGLQQKDMLKEEDLLTEKNQLTKLTEKWLNTNKKEMNLIKSKELFQKILFALTILKLLNNLKKNLKNG